MRIDIITVLPEMIEGFFNCSIMKRAQDKGLAEIHIHNLRDYTEDKYRRVDDYPFGGFAGMVMKIEPIERCINALKAERDYDEVIFTTPDGEQFNQPMANSLSLAQNLIILCGHFKGIDYRIREHLITKEISIGDYVLTGGELAAAVMADAIVRIIPESFLMNSPHFPILSRIICWQHLYIHDLRIIKVGKSPIFSYPVMKQKSKNGNCNNPWNVPENFVPTYWENKIKCK